MAKLPRLPPPPARHPPASTRSAVIEVKAWEDADEPSTKPTNESLAVYTSLLSVFDSLTQPERVEFVELAALWAELPREERGALLGLISRR